MGTKCFVIFFVGTLGYIQAVPTCPTQSAGIEFYQDPDDCGRYYECYGGILSHMSCPANLYWNTNLNTCDYAPNVDCGTRPLPSSATSSGTTPSSSSQSTANTATTPSYDPDPQCPATTENITFYPDPSNCKQYFECNRGQRYTIVCPANLLYNVNEEACDYPEHVNCVGRSTPTSSASTQTPTPVTSASPTIRTTTNAPSSTTTQGTTTSYDPDPQCPATTENITFYPDPSNCKQYFECNRGQRYTIVCPANLLYNVNEEACDYPEHVNCVGRSTPTSPANTQTATPVTSASTAASTVPSTTTPAPTTRTSTNAPSPTTTQGTTTSYDPDPQCPATVENITFYPDPSNCKQYFECNRGQRFTIVCPDNLLYNVNEQACDYPEHVNCVGRSTPSATASTPSATTTTTTSTSRATTTPPPPTTTQGTTTSYDPNPICPATTKNITFYPDPSNCKQYFECDRGQRFTMICPGELLWNVNEDACDYPEHVSCTGRSTPMTSATSTTSQTTPITATTNSGASTSIDPNPQCPATSKNITFYPDPSNCKNFFECNRGIRYSMVCPGELLWSMTAVACDYPENVNCSGRSTPAGTQTTATPTSAATSATTSSGTTGAASTTSSPGNPCKNRADGTYIGDPDDCTIFYHCKNGSGEKEYCKTGLNWCQEELTCDWPNKSGCSCYVG